MEVIQRVPPTGTIKTSRTHIHQHRAHSGWVEVEKGDVQCRDEIVKLNQVRHTKMVWLGGWWLGGGWLVVVSGSVDSYDWS